MTSDHLLSVLLLKKAYGKIDRLISVKDSSDQGIHTLTVKQSSSKEHMGAFANSVNLCTTAAVIQSFVANAWSAVADALLRHNN